jgi:hypothetical protein
MNELADLGKFTEHEEYANMLNEQFQKATGLTLKPIGSHIENCGGTSSGKTHREKVLFVSLFRDLFNEVFVVAPNAKLDQWHKLGIPEQNLYEQTINENLLNMIKERAKKNFENPPDGSPPYHWATLVIIDDNGEDTRKTYFSDFLIRARHWNVSIHTLAQSSKMNNPTARQNYHYYMLKPLEYNHKQTRAKFAEMRGIPDTRTDALSLDIPTLEEAVAEWNERYSVNPKGAAYDYILVDCKSCIPQMFICRLNDIQPVTYRGMEAKLKNGKNITIKGKYDPVTRGVSYSM